MNRLRLTFHLTIVLVALLEGSGTVEAQGILAEIERELMLLVRKVSPGVVSVRTLNLRSSEWQRGVHWYQKNVGSGVVFDDAGHILTGENVVSESSKIEVHLSSGEVHPAQFLGADRESRVAVIKIPSGLAARAELGDSDQIQQWQWAIIVGHCYERFPSLSWGVITDVDDQKLIHLTANAYPGGSGAPVFNKSGKVMGIVVAAMADPMPPMWADDQASGVPVPPLERGSSPMALAVPINSARRIADALIENGGRPEYGWLGVVGESPVGGRGILVKSVMRGSPAERAGLREGDVIVRYEDQEVLDLYGFAGRVVETPVGKRVTLGLRRGTKELSLGIRVGNRMGTPPREDQRHDPSLSQSDRMLQLKVQYLERELRTLRKMLDRK